VKSLHRGEARFAEIAHDQRSVWIVHPNHL
jgi:hypothetical protein